jgi:hypothetical protein
MCELTAVDVGVTRARRYNFLNFGQRTGERTENLFLREWLKNDKSCRYSFWFEYPRSHTCQ